LTDDTQIRFDERGARLLRTRVFFSSKPMFSPEELEEKDLLTRRDLDGTWWGEFYLIPAEMRAGALYVAVTVHSHPPHDSHEWELTFALAPTGSPPDFITRAAYEGAFPDNLRELVEKAFPADGPANIRARIYYALDLGCFPKIVEQFRLISSANRSDGISLQPKSSEWDVHGATHITAISISLADDEEPRLRVVVRATVDVKISETTHRDVDGQVWQELISCLG
jgi:hypothetical protein